MKSAVVGWSFIDAARPQVFVVEQQGEAPHAVDLEASFASQAIQTGAFRRGKPIFDPVTRQLLGYEIENVSAYSA